MKHFMQWLRPGLAIKRWMVLFSVGILLLVFGATLILNYQIFGIMEERMLGLAFQMTGSYSYTFLAVCGTLFVILGLWIMTTAVRKLMKRLGVPYQDCHSTGTVVHVAMDGAYAGHILISDLLKPSAKTAMEALRTSGVKQTVMLTGDIDAVAQATAKELGINTVYSELLPGDKVSKVEELLDQKHTGKLAFVGDGINDAPVLSRADIGIAMGAMGSDAAIEAADVVLMDDDPMKIAKAIRISRKCLRIVHENIVFAIGIKLACLLLVAIGKANMWAAIFADVGVMVLAVLNAIRALRVHNL